ncbi:MAG: hypothetical protein LUF00_03455 [Lachnospiraceae bacterium]|nr:hypothetical protein [Lachnospiraceae bacterium]
MPFGKKNDKPKHTFSPGSHGTVYMLGAIYLAYLLVTFLQGAYKGGEDAPSLPLLIGGILVLGGGTVFLVLMAWRMSHMPPKTDDETAEDYSGSQGRKDMENVQTGAEVEPPEQEEP